VLIVVTCIGCSVSPSVTGARAEYDQMNNTVRLENVSGLQANGANTFTIDLSASGIEDKTGNKITDNSGKFQTITYFSPYKPTNNRYPDKKQNIHALNHLIKVRFF